MTDDAQLDLIEMLESVPHFSILSFDDKQRLVSLMELAEFLPGDPLIHEDEEQENLDFIFDGVVEVLKTSADGSRVAVARLGPGEIIGEAALQPSPSPSTVLIRAREKTKTLRMSHDNFQALMIDSPQTAFKVLIDILRLLRGRLNAMSEQLADHMARDRPPGP